MIESKWSEKDAQTFVDKYGSVYGRDLALRTYSARLIGAESELVLHGGGNTSVKSVFKNILGQELPAIFVKGSGWDLAAIEPAGHPGLDLEYLRKLRAVPRMSDDVMVNELRTHLFDAAAPTPSVETLLHAFLPAKFIDHSHADAIVRITNTIHGENLARECFGDEVVYVPYIMPGFDLALLAAKLFDQHPNALGMVLIRHGLFTFGATAKESYERHLHFVNRAEEIVRSKPHKALVMKAVSKLDPAVVLPILRGEMALKDESGNCKKRFIFDLRVNPLIERFLGAVDLVAISQTGPLTPDHIIRTKAAPMVVELAGAQGPEEIRARIRVSLANYGEAYEQYFTRCCKARRQDKQKLDSLPRVVLIPGVGLIGVGDTAQAAAIASDIYEHTIAVKTEIAEFSGYLGLPELDLFDMEYWSLEQAKLALQKPKPLNGRVAVITGGAGAIGIGIASVLKAAGAEVVITDVQNVEAVSKELKVAGMYMDVTSAAGVEKTFAAIVAKFGGVDIVIPNAGIALSAPLEKIDEAAAHRVMDINFHGYFNTMKVAASYFKSQNSGGHIVVISSKNVTAPGKEFSIYSASKAAGHQVGKVAALELAPFGVRVNMITPDAVFGAGDHQSGLWQAIGPERAKARGLELKDLENFYRERNLLKAKVSAEDVGRAVLFFVTEQTPTTGANLPVDGGVAEAFPR